MITSNISFQGFRGAGRLAICSFLICGLFSFSSAQVKDQADSTFLKNEIGIDFSKVIFLVRGAGSYTLNYKRHMSNYAARLGLNFEFGSGSGDGETDVDIRTGVERKSTVGKWQFFYGMDVNYNHVSYRYRTSKTNGIGLGPFVGFRFCASPRFSISTEPHLNATYWVYRDPGSFSDSENTEELIVEFQSVGNILLNFHF